MICLSEICKVSHLFTLNVISHLFAHSCNNFVNLAAEHLGQLSSVIYLSI